MSMGGMIAQELALGWADRVDRPILGCTHAGVANTAPQPSDAGRAFAMQTDDWALRMCTLAPFAFARAVDPALLKAFIEKKSGDAQDAAGYAAQIQAVLGHDTLERLAEIAAPTLIVTGDDDRVIPATSSLFFDELIPDSRLCTIPGAGHLFFIEQPQQTLEPVSAFLDASA
jgi:3-oxoadipate enol-lactonase